MTNLITLAKKYTYEIITAAIAIAFGAGIVWNKVAEAQTTAVAAMSQTEINKIEIVSMKKDIEYIKKNVAEIHDAVVVN